MRSAPNFVQGMAVNGKWKEELLIFLGNEFGLNILCETGTCEGSTLLAVHNNFEQCYSIELSEHYYNIAKERLKVTKNIALYQGNSNIMLRYILEYFVRAWDKDRNNKVLFWLDAHSSGGLTANEGDPLPEEIRAIVELSPDSLVVIDDHQSADQVINKCIEANIDLTGFAFEYRTGIVFMYKPGLYNIPEFE